MKRNYQRMLSMILAIFLLLSGICLENTKTDSHIMSSFAKQEVGLSASLDAEYTYVQSCTEELLGQETTSNIVDVVRNINVRKDSKQSFVVLFVNPSVHSLFHFNTIEHTIVSPEKQCGDVILSYIHNQDGKK